MTPEVRILWAQCVIRNTKTPMNWQAAADEFAQLIAKQCIEKLESYCIPVGNSAAGEIACEMTYRALLEIRDDIKESFGIADA